MKNIRRYVLISRANSVWYCMNNRNRDDKKKLTLEKTKKGEKNET